MNDVLELVKYVVTQFAENKEETEFSVKEKERVNAITVTLTSSDMGKVIGKQGKIAKALRTLAAAMTPAGEKKIVIDIEEKNGTLVDRDDAEAEA